jgi:hypothetical protein
MFGDEADTEEADGNSRSVVSPLCTASCDDSSKTSAEWGFGDKGSASTSVVSPLFKSICDGFSKDAMNSGFDRSLDGGRVMGWIVSLDFSLSGELVRILDTTVGRRLVL